MADTLAQLTTKLQYLLLDNGTLFVANTCTAAIRQALNQMNQQLPVHAGTFIDIVSGQYEYELTTALAGAEPIQITDVLLQDPSTQQYDTALDFDAYIEDERWFLRLHSPQSATHLIVRFTQPHTINGLDSATESTMPAFYDPVLLDGAAAYACAVAAAGKAEANNIDPRVPNNYIEAARLFRSAFNTGIAMIHHRRHHQVSVPDQRTWQDNYHSSTWN